MPLRTVAALGGVLALGLGASAASEAVASQSAVALERAWDRALDASGGTDTPVTRVVTLLKKISEQLDKDMEQDESLYKQLSCWCNDGKYEKMEAIKASEAKIEELKATIESFGAGSSELAATIKELEAEVAENKRALAEAKAIRDKQLGEFHNMEKDSIQALENLKAAIVVLSKHHDKAPDSSVAGGPIFKTEKDSWSLLSIASRRFPWSASHETAAGRSLDEFMRKSGVDDEAVAEAPAVERPVSSHKFLQERAVGTDASATWTEQDTQVLQRAMKSAASFVQAKHGSEYFPAYNSQSGEIFGVLKQLREEMAADLKEAQEIENDRSKQFKELREAKEAEIANGEKMAEEKEDLLANGDNALAEAKEDLGQEEKVLAADQKFLANLEKMCAEGASSFEERKQARMEEMKAVAETIEILTADDARDAMSATYAKSFVQLASTSRRSSARALAAAKLRAAARAAQAPELSMLATSVELDGFEKVKKAIDNMISMLKVQQADEVKKNDWCKDEFHENDMATAKADDRKADLSAQIEKLKLGIKALDDAIAELHRLIGKSQLELQRSSADRQQENKEFQQTIADQTVTIEVLKKALDRLATHYDFLQQRAVATQTPPVPQMEYKPNSGAGGVMEMIEKLIHEAGDLKKDAKKGESEAQAAYEQLVADTNAAVEEMQKEIVSKKAAKAEAGKDLRQAESDLGDTMQELEGLAKYNARLHKECDYLLKNFELRQKSRGEEVEALQQAKQILSGAELS